MDTTHSPWRLGSKIVAFVDLVLLSISLFIVILLVVMSSGATAAASSFGGDYRGTLSSDQISAGQGIVSAVLAFVWALVLLYALLVGIMIWAALKLLGASEVGTEPKEALGKARTWRNVTIIFMVLFIISCLVMGTYIALFIEILWRGGVLFVVCNYMQELEYIVTNQNPNAGTNSIPVDVIVVK